MASETIYRLEEIKDEMLGLLGEAEGLIRDEAKGMEYERARSYWLAHIETALTNDHGYLGGSMVTMQDTIQELEEAEDGRRTPPSGCETCEATDASACRGCPHA